MNVRRIEDDNGNRFYELEDGRRPPGVTSILQAVGLVNYEGIPEDRLEAAAERGSEVHQAIADLENGIEPWWDPDGELQGYVNAWRQFRMDFQFLVNAIEVPTYSELFHMAGTPDAVGLVANARLGQARRPAIVEIKATYELNPWTHLQTAGYALIQANGFDSAFRWARLAVLLQPGGTYEVHIGEDKADFATMLAARACVRWQHQHFRRPD